MHKLFYIVVATISLERIFGRLLKLSLLFKKDDWTDACNACSDIDSNLLPWLMALEAFYIFFRLVVDLWIFNLCATAIYMGKDFLC